MSGTQLSAAWLVSQAAETLASSDDLEKRRAGRALRCCEVVGVEKVSEDTRKRNTQGIEFRLAFYDRRDRRAVVRREGDVECAISEALCGYGGAVQIAFESAADAGQWLGVDMPATRGGTGKRLSRYFTDTLRREFAAKGGVTADRMLKHAGEVEIILRRLRYRLGMDYSGRGPRYAFWTTETTTQWSEAGGHQLDYLVHYLCCYASDDTLKSGHATEAPSLHPGFWGEVDTEKDPLRVQGLTTSGGTTGKDVDAVLGKAGAQVDILKSLLVRSTEEQNRLDPLKAFIDGLQDILDNDREWLAKRRIDVLLIHRGGGVHPASSRRRSNVTPQRRKELLELCRAVRDMGIEVVVAIGHADVSALRSEGARTDELPLGVFEATTPTAGASWILQEHINPRLVDTSVTFLQQPTG